MRFEKFLPSATLKPYINHFVISENEMPNTYKVLPSTGLVIGFQYKGQLAIVDLKGQNKLESAGITGISRSHKIFRNTTAIGTVLVYFTETGFTHFCKIPANELFNTSIGLNEIFERSEVNKLEEQLFFAQTDTQRIAAVESFLCYRLNSSTPDLLVTAAVELIKETRGTLSVTELSERLCTSISPLEKRFRKIVGVTPKKFASIIKLNHVVERLNQNRPLHEICYENHFFDQAHFNKAFKTFSGETPKSFRHH